MDSKSVGLVQTEYCDFYDEKTGFQCELGGVLWLLQIAYETYGTLNSKKTNAILITHALSGDAHVAGYHQGDEKPGWWDDMVGPQKAFDTDRYFIICSNVLGGCKGTSGPSSINPKTKKPYGLEFPLLTIGDMVRVQKKLVDFLGIKKLLCVAGGSMGGMQALLWSAIYPECVENVIAISTALKHSPQQIAFSEVGRQAIMADPEWRAGNYYDFGQPYKGLSVARMIGHITYMSQSSMEDKFSRRKKKEGIAASFTTEFEVEGYLRYQGDAFVKRFDANSYLYLTKAMDYFDLSGDALFAHGKPRQARFLVLACDSDWLYPASQSEEVVRVLKNHNVEATYFMIQSNYGHDAFLIEFDEQARIIRNFLNQTLRKT